MSIRDSKEAVSARTFSDFFYLEFLYYCVDSSEYKVFDK